MAVAGKVAVAAVLMGIEVRTKAVTTSDKVAGMVVAAATKTGAVMLVAAVAAVVVTKTTTAATLMEWIKRPSKRMRRWWQG